MGIVNQPTLTVPDVLAMNYDDLLKSHGDTLTDINIIYDKNGLPSRALQDELLMGRCSMVVWKQSRYISAHREPRSTLFRRKGSCHLRASYLACTHRRSHGYRLPVTAAGQCRQRHNRKDDISFNDAPVEDVPTHI